MPLLGEASRLLGTTGRSSAWRMARRYGIVGGSNLKAAYETNKLVKGLVHVHPVLGRALDERGLQLLCHVFAVRR